MPISQHQIPIIYDMCSYTGGGISMQFAQNWSPQPLHSFTLSEGSSKLLLQVTQIQRFSSIGSADKFCRIFFWVGPSENFFQAAPKQKSSTKVPGVQTTM